MLGPSECQIVLSFYFSIEQIANKCPFASELSKELSKLLEKTVDQMGRE